MQTVRSESGGHPRRSGAASIRDLPMPVGGPKKQVVIRLPELISAAAYELAAPQPLAVEHVDAFAPSLVEFEPIADEPNDKPTLLNAPILLSATEMAPATETTAMPVVPNLPDHTETATSSTNLEHASMFATCWSAVARGHAFLMQPKVWLACVISCTGFIIVAFYLHPPARQPETDPKTVQTPVRAPQPAADPVTEIVAPPADMPAAESSHGLDLQSTAHVVPPLYDPALHDPSAPAQQPAASQTEADPIRMAADPRGPGTARFDGTSDAESPAATISGVAPLDVPDDLSPKGGTLR